MDIAFCYDAKTDFNWNREKATLIETTNEDGIIEVNPKITYVQSYSIVFELKDENKKLVRYECVERQFAETDEMISVQQKTSYMSSPEIQTMIEEDIAAAKIKYANYFG
ncbi:MAG: hypothetical protein EOM05_10445 [Clostridia bacterium]|nr:hypothetical protein [Clostridia bacterium]